MGIYDEAKKRAKSREEKKTKCRKEIKREDEMKHNVPKNFCEERFTYFAIEKYATHEWTKIIGCCRHRKGRKVTS
jgi:hypothetical protein